MQRGFSLIGTLSLSLVFLVLLFVVLSVTENNRKRISKNKNQEAAYWQAVSGADLLESRLRKGILNPSHSLISPENRDGHFEASVKNQRTILSTGYCGNRSYVLERKLGENLR